MSETYVYETLLSGYQRLQQQHDALVAEREKLMSAEARINQIDQQLATLQAEITLFSKRVDAHRPVVVIPQVSVLEEPQNVA